MAATPAISRFWISDTNSNVVAVKNFLIIVLGVALLISWFYPQQCGGVSSRPVGAVPPELSTPPPDPDPAPPAPPDDRYAALRLLLREASLSPGLQGSALGFCLIDGSGKVVVGVNDGTAFIPASTLKTVTTATALQRLGPDFRFFTRLLGTTPVAEGILAGDLVVEGGADPLLAMVDLTAWAVTLKERGLREVQGRIIGDGRYFKGSLFDDFWNWGDIGNGYGSAVSGLNLEHNRFTVTLVGGAASGDPASVLSIVPEVPGVQGVNEVITGPADSGDNVVIYGGERTGVITLRGSVPEAKESVIVGAVPDPEGFAAYHFGLALAGAGIAVKGPAVAMNSLAGNEPPAGSELLKHTSPPLLDLITSIHATSDNHESECLYRQLGLMEKKAPDEVIREHWKAQGLDFTGLRMEDGCGLARANHIRPLDLARLQFLSAQGPQGAAWKGSLLAEGPVISKGGAMSSIRSSTGYINSRSGEVFCFAFMVNHYADSQSVSHLQQALYAAVAEF